jgi:hypothetical protein
MLTRRRRQPSGLESNAHPQGETCGGFMNHSRAAAHELLGTRSTARATANNNAATTITTNLIIGRGISRVPPLCPPLLRRGVLLPRGAGSWGRVAGPSLGGAQVAVLRPYVASSCHVTASAYSPSGASASPKCSIFVLNVIKRPSDDYISANKSSNVCLHSPNCAGLFAEVCTTVHRLPFSCDPPLMLKKRIGVPAVGLRSSL